MKIKTAEFLVSAVAPGQFPPPVLPEVAFAGKSNVGKSSLMNCLLQRRRLVKTSGTPGKTRQINFFVVNQEFNLVDLPGYGYARVSRSEQRSWERLVVGYLLERPTLRGVVMIVDVRHAPSALDLELRAWLAANGVPFVVVANKADKLKRAALTVQLRALGSALGCGASVLGVSAAKGTGRDGLWRHLDGWLAGSA